MKKIIRPLLTLFFFWTLFGWTFGQPALANDYETLNASIMRPDPVTLREWLQKSKEAPKTAIDTDIQQKVLQTMSEGLGASNSLLGQISYVPAERNQGGCGNCWNWAGTGVLEVALRAQQGVAQNKLSIQYLNSCKTDQFACCGGWLSTYANWYAQPAQKKAVPWSNTNASFADANSDCRNGSSARSCGSISTTPNYPITAITMETVPVAAGNQAATIANIKSVIDGGRAIWFGFFLPNQTAWDNFFSFWNNQNQSAVFNMSGYCGANYDQNGGGHAVVLVGYNDSVAEPYWEFLNSWGTASGMRPDGLFRIRMNMNYDCSYNFSGGLDDAFYWQTLNVQFQGSPPPTGCSYSISPQSEYVSTSGGTRTVNVTASRSDCGWAASESIGWVTLNSPYSGVGNGNFSYNVAANSGSQRSGGITITGTGPGTIPPPVTHTVIQEGTGALTNLLKNPGFEDQVNIIWQEIGDYPIFLYKPCDPGSPFCAYGGDWLAWLGGWDDDYRHLDIINQPVYIPANATRMGLKFMYSIETDEDPNGDAFDYLAVYVSDANYPDTIWEMLLLKSNLDATDGWISSPVLKIPPAFLGKNVLIEFWGESDGSYVTHFFVDNVVLAEFNFVHLPLILK